MVTIILSLLTFAFWPPGVAATDLEHILREKLKKVYDKALEKNRLEQDILKASGKAVPVLIEVMKSDSFPDANRWLATFLLGKIMGKKASPFIVKFTDHPLWTLRMAALKTLLALGDTRYAKDYARALKDDALLVRGQALENIVRLNLKGEAPSVWAMLHDKRNYYDQKKKEGKTHIVKSIIRAVGQLELDPALGTLVSMIQKDEHLDIYPDIEYSLHRITGKKRPSGGIQDRRRYWSRMANGNN